MTFEEDQEVARMAYHYQTFPGQPEDHALWCSLVNIGYVYFIKAENGLFKIGRTNDIKKRISDLGRMSPAKLELYHYFKTFACARAERTLHELYAPYRRHGEWFELPEEVQSEILNYRTNFM